MGIAELGHVGLYVTDLERQQAFYRDVLGLTVTDADLDAGLVFMSSRPDVEHHELLLCHVADRSSSVQQVSFRCESLDDVTRFHRRFVDEGVTIERTVTHGNAVGVYFEDPEGNRCEVYWQTGREARQPFAVKLDLAHDHHDILQAVDDAVERYGSTGTYGQAASALAAELSPQGTS